MCLGNCASGGKGAKKGRGSALLHAALAPVCPSLMVKEVIAWRSQLRLQDMVIVFRDREVSLHMSSFLVLEPANAKQ